MLGPLLKLAAKSLVSAMGEALRPLARRTLRRALDPEPEGEPHPLSYRDVQHIQRQRDGGAREKPDGTL